MSKSKAFLMDLDDLDGYGIDELVDAYELLFYAILRKQYKRGKNTGEL